MTIVYHSLADLANLAKYIANDDAHLSTLVADLALISQANAALASLDSIEEYKSHSAEEIFAETQKRTFISEIKAQVTGCLLQGSVSGDKNNDSLAIYRCIARVLTSLIVKQKVERNSQ